METGKLVSIAINDKLIHAQLSETLTLVTSDNVSDWDVQPDRSWSMNFSVNTDGLVNACNNAIDALDSLKMRMNNLKAEITIDGKVVERQIKSCGSKMVRKIERNKAYARPVIYYIEEFYCKF